MKIFTYFSLVSGVVSLAHGHIPPWHPPTNGEVRSPCPGINVLANHNILPRSGRNLERQTVIDALSTWYNIEPAISINLFDRAVNYLGHPGATTFDMVDIWVHHIATVDAIEGDVNFSRADYFWGDNHSLNHTVWAQTRSFWTGETIDVQKFGNAARARYTTSRATNPTFYYEDVSNIGTAMAFMTGVLGDSESGTVPTRYVEDWIVKERLPARLGWRRSEKVTDEKSVMNLSSRIFQASGLASADPAKAKSEGFVHVGFRL